MARNHTTIVTAIFVHRVDPRGRAANALVGEGFKGAGHVIPGNVEVRTSLPRCAETVLILAGKNSVIEVRAADVIKELHRELVDVVGAILLKEVRRSAQGRGGWPDTTGHLRGEVVKQGLIALNLNIVVRVMGLSTPENIATGLRERLRTALERGGKGDGGVEIRAALTCSGVILIHRPDADARCPENGEVRRTAAGGEEKAGALQGLAVEKHAAVESSNSLVGGLTSLVFVIVSV